MIHIEDLISEQTSKMYGELNGGDKYGHDYNILKSILRHHKNEALVESIIEGLEGLEDEILKAKVKIWMSGAIMGAA